MGFMRQGSAIDHLKPFWFFLWCAFLLDLVDLVPWSRLKMPKNSTFRALKRDFTTLGTSLGTSSGQDPSEPEKLVGGGVSVKVGKLWFSNLRLRIVGQFLTKQTTRWNSRGKSRTKLRMSIYYTSLGILYLDHSKDPHLAAAGLTVSG